MKIALWNWHTPYTYLLAKALPEHTILVRQTPYSPLAWLRHQRPIPPNVVIGWAPRDADVVLIQNILDTKQQAWYRDVPKLFLAHNRSEFEDGVSFLLMHKKVPIVAISEMKAATYRLTLGDDYPITVIPPGIPREDFGPWLGKGRYLLTVCNGIRRVLFDLENWLIVMGEVGVPEARLIGEGNEGVPYAVGPARNYDELRTLYARCDGYVNPTMPPYEDLHNLASLEAAAAGCPIINLHGTHPPIDQFPFSAFRENWLRVLENVCG